MMLDISLDFGMQSVETAESLNFVIPPVPPALGLP
jgi:hypothetical protein